MQSLKTGYAEDSSSRLNGVSMTARLSLSQWFRRMPQGGRTRPRWLQVRGLEYRMTPAVFTVTTLADGAVSKAADLPGSLRQAIFDANVAAGTDIVEFKAGLSGTITLTTGELLISDALLIDGPGPGLVTVSGNSSGRVFRVDTRGSGTSIIIDGLTVANGKVSGTGLDGRGAIVLNIDEALMMSDCTITNGIATERAGGVLVQSDVGSLTLIRCTVSNNKATGSVAHGAAISLNGASRLVIDQMGLHGL